MSKYPYLIQTSVGWATPYTTESNVPATEAPNKILFINNPLPETRSKLRFYVIQPVLSNGMILNADGTTQSLSKVESLVGQTVAHASDGAPIIMGHPMDIKNGDINTAVPLSLPGIIEPNTLFWILVAVIFIVSAAAIIAQAWAAYHHDEYIEHAYDVAAQSQDLAERLYINTDTGEVFVEYQEGCTIERRTLNNGEVIDVPLNAAGQAFNEASCGSPICVINEGVDTEALFDKILNAEFWGSLITWIAIGAVAVGGIYIAAKVLPGWLSKKKSKSYSASPSYSFTQPYPSYD